MVLPTTGGRRIPSTNRKVSPCLKVTENILIVGEWVIRPWVVGHVTFSVLPSIAGIDVARSLTVKGYPNRHSRWKVRPD
jgi:hypothetical protein